MQTVEHVGFRLSRPSLRATRDAPGFIHNTDANGNRKILNRSETKSKGINRRRRALKMAVSEGMAFNHHGRGRSNVQRGLAPIELVLDPRSQLRPRWGNARPAPAI